MEFIFSLLVFIVTIYLSFYLPGKLVLVHLYPKLEKKELSFLAWPLGVSLFILINYLLSWMNIPYLYLVLIAGIFIAALVKNRSLFSISFFLEDKWIAWMIIFGSIIFTSFSVLSGWVTKSGEKFYDLNALDGVLHIAYIKSQALFFPPRHPEVVGMTLRGYHYFYDYLLSRFVLFSHLSAEDLFFRFFPLFISLLFGFSFYLLSKRITKNVWSQRAIIFLVFFGEGFAYFLSLIRSDFNPLTAQSLDLILDPSMVLSGALLASALVLLPQIKKSWGASCVVAILLGVLTQLKVYTGVTAAGALVLFIIIAGYKLSLQEKLRLGTVVLIVGLLTVVTFFPNNLGAGGFLFAPFNLYEQFMQQDFFLKFHFGELLAIYKDHHNILRLAQLAIEATGVFWLINIGIRLIFFKEVKQIISKQFWKSEYTLLLISIISISILVPTFFLQTPSVFNIMQFTWIAILFLNIPAGIAIGNILQKRNLVIKLVTMVILVAIALPYLLSMEKKYLVSKPLLTIPSEQLIIFNDVTATVSPSKYVIVLPDRLTYTTKDGHVVDKLLWYPSPLVSAMTGRNVYYEGNITPDTSIEMESQKRIQNMFVLSTAIKNCNTDEIENELQKISSKYLFTYYPQPCLATSSAMLKKFETNKISFYQFK